jgi:hypothetical protein
MTWPGESSISDHQRGIAVRYTAVAIIAGTLVSAQTGWAAECGMAKAFNVGGKVGVWSDPSGKSLFFSSDLKTNTDGTKRSYSVSDFWGQSTALNNLCNAMSDACAGLDQAGLRERRILTQQARSEGWPAGKLATTRISRDIIPFRGGKPCPEIDGYLVSATALENPKISDICNPSRYVDALQTPALVIPKGENGFSGRGVAKGDLVVAMTPKSEMPVYAIIGDLGPPNSLGEGSIAMAGKLLGRTAEPKNYVEIKNSWQIPRAFILIFPGSRDQQDPFSMTTTLNQAGPAAIQAWGGVERLKACDAEHSAIH